MGAVFTFKNFNGNLIASGIVGLICGYLASKFYKAIIGIAIIIGILYFILQNN